MSEPILSTAAPLPGAAFSADLPPAAAPEPLSAPLHEPLALTTEMRRDAAEPEEDLAPAESAAAPVPAALPPLRRETITLPPGASGTARTIEVLRFGTPGARPKAYLQAGLHADELPGMLTLRELVAMLTEEAERGRVTGEVVVVPVCNPVGLSQHPHGLLTGRYETGSSENFNRGWPDLAAQVASAVDGRMGDDAVANVATIRAALAEAVADLPAATEMEGLRKALYSLAHDADFVLDLHADNEADVHLYIGTPLWPDAADLAAEIDARAVLLAEVSGGNPFDESLSGLWWDLARRFPLSPVPPACLSCTVELRSNNSVDDRLARDDANALLRFLKRRNVVEGSAGSLPTLRCEATPLDGMQQVTAPVDGLVVYHLRLGDRVEAGELVAEIVDPLGGRTEVLAETSGVLFARQEQRYAWAGRIIGKIAGAVPLTERMGTVLLPA